MVYNERVYRSYNGPGDGESIGYTGGSGGAIGAVIGAAAGLYDSYQNRKASKENTNRTIAAQKAEAELAYQRSVEMWHLQNQYNDPQSQMQRFIAGGLNPHLIYGQGNPGNASSPPQYQPASMQYKYEAPTYGAAIQTILPTLMAVGTWMQNMRKSEVEIDRSSTETERARQMIDYLTRANPKLLDRLDNQLSLYPYQSQIMSLQADTARAKLFELGNEFKYKYGDDLWRDSGIPGSARELGGTRKLQLMQELFKTKLLEAKSSYTDLDITDPQALMQMVLGGVMGLAGQTLRLSTHRRPKVTTEVEERMRTGRSRIRRRTTH